MSARPSQQPDPRRVARRASYFFRSGRRSRGEVASFADRLADLGSVAVIGGMLRDLSLAGNAGFRSDVDFVVDPGSIAEFERLMAALGARRNRFGGYGIALRRWRVDVWPLERTWAAVAGHVEVRRPEDLLDATFFDWDAILYICSTRSVTARPDYFERLERRVLEVNLEPNPNPVGNAVRAIRYARRWNAAFGPRLAHHILRQARDHGWDTLARAERASFGTRVLATIDLEGLGRALRVARDHGHARFEFESPQEDLFSR